MGWRERDRINPAVLFTLSTTTMYLEEKHRWGDGRTGGGGGGEDRGTHTHTCRRNLRDLCQGCDGVGDHHGRAVAEEVLEQVQEALVLHQPGVDVVQLCHTHCGRLAHVGVLILEVRERDGGR